MILAADVWRWVPHPEVWVLVLGLAWLYRYAIKEVGPRACLPGETVVTRSQVRWAVAALVTLWIASDWPMHDVGEDWMYFVHMAQHTLLQLVFPAMVLLAIPTWLARMVVGSGRGYRVVRFLTRFVPATIIFNVVVLGTHAPSVVSASVENPLFHYLAHVVVVASGFIMWMGVCGPLPELRFPLPLQMVHLAVQSIIPAVPAGWLTFAESAVYRSYDHGMEVWGLTVTEDQQLAAAVMKLGSTTLLWVVIAIIFMRMATKTVADDRSSGVELDRRAPGLTYEQVQRAFEASGAAPSER